MFSRTIARRINPSFFMLYQILGTSGLRPTKYMVAHIPDSISLCSANTSKLCWYSQQASADNMNVDYEYVKRASSQNDVLIVDVREPDEIKEHGKIPNSINIPLGSVTSTLSTMPETEFEKVFNKPKPKEDTEMIFYCMIGKRSATAQQNALNLGYKNAKNYLGSWTDWANKRK